MAELNELLQVEDFVEEAETEPEAEKPTPSRRRLAQALAAVLLCVGAVLCLVPSPMMSSRVNGIQATNRNRSCGVSRSCGLRQLTTDAPNDPQCPQTQAAPVRHGKVVLDYAYKGGRLRLSEVALNLQETFCVKQNCYRGVISAGGASGDDEKQVLFEHLKGNSPDQIGGDTFGQYANLAGDVSSLKIVFTPDPQKGDVAKKIFDWLNSPEGKKANIPADKVWLFDDHRGNAGEMAKYGFNGREVSCKTRDQSIGDGLVGLCGAELSEIVPSLGVSTCA
ncbi:Hypothetical protein SCF082_LOCUS18415 [Durusdinium trenchii]|uniref:Uncharacterized protein n=1 Tax=Durusdinium trenchii TaxID=1381693 RepID=A0ABP0KNX5_9DINO